MRRTATLFGLALLLGGCAGSPPVQSEAVSPPPAPSAQPALRSQPPAPTLSALPHETTTASLEQDSTRADRILAALRREVSAIPFLQLADWLENLNRVCWQQLAPEIAVLERHSETQLAVIPQARPLQVGEARDALTGAAPENLCAGALQEWLASERWSLPGLRLLTSWDPVETARLARQFVVQAKLSDSARRDRVQRDELAPPLARARQTPSGPVVVLAQGRERFVVRFAPAREEWQREHTRWEPAEAYWVVD